MKELLTDPPLQNLYDEFVGRVNHRIIYRARGSFWTFVACNECLPPVLLISNIKWKTSDKCTICLDLHDVSLDEMILCS